MFVFVKVVLGCFLWRPYSPAGGAPSFLKDRRMKEVGLNSGCHTRGPQGPGGVLCRETLLPRGRGPFFPKGQTDEGVGPNSGCHTRGPQGPGGVLCRETLLPRGRGPFFPEGQMNEGGWGEFLSIVALYKAVNDRVILDHP